uniref:C2H2-type domain-containing protein n=1 Tax=Acrobeloides nanus TaxID=290746 RepID=A0A914BZV2_9BILA
MSENESDEEISETDKKKNKQSKFPVTSSKSYDKQPEISEKTQNQKEVLPQSSGKPTKNVQDSGISSSNSLVTSSTSQNRKSENPEPVKVIKKKVSKETMPSLSVLLENIIEQVTKGKQTIKCIQCKEDVANDFRTKEKHVRKSHPNFSIDACFPGSIATSELECAICGKEYRSETGRLNHVAEQHIELYLKCPLCDVQNRITPKMTEHFKRVHEIHENELPLELSKKWKHQKEEFYARMNVLVKKVFPIKLKEAKNAENIDEPLSSLFEPTVFSSHKAQLQASSTNTNIAGSSTGIRQSPIISPPRRTLASALSKIIGGDKEISREKPKMQLVQAPVSGKRIETESSNDSSDDSLLPGQVTTKKTIVMTKKADNSQEEERKRRLQRTKDWYVRLPSSDSSSIELSSDSESELLARKSAAPSKKLVIKSEPKSSSESRSDSESEDEQSEEIVELDDELNDQVKAETEEEQDQASRNFEVEDIIKMEEPLIEENAVAISGISDQEVFDHFCVKNLYELLNLPQFRPPDGWNVNEDIFDRYKMVCFKFLRKTMLSLSPTNFNVHELYRLISNDKWYAFLSNLWC